MGGKKNRRAQRKVKRARKEAQRTVRPDEGPARADEGSAEARPVEAGGLESPEKPGRSAEHESHAGSRRGKRRERSKETDVLEVYPLVITDERQNIINETHQELRTKYLEANELTDLLVDAMHSWVKDMLKKAEVVKAEITTTRDLVLPTCAVLDKLKSGYNEGEIYSLVDSIMGKVEYMASQIPVATAVVGKIMEQIDMLQKECLSTSNRELEAIPDESSSSAEPHTEENTPVASSSDPESDTIEQSQQESVMAGSSEDAQMEEVKEAPIEENSGENPDDISKEILVVLRIKDEETNEFKNLLTDAIKYRVRDMMKKIELVTTEASVTRNLVIYTCDVTDSLQLMSAKVEVHELKTLTDVVLGKVEYLMQQVSAATTIVEYAMDQIGELEGTDNFKHEVYMQPAYDAANFLDSSNETHPGSDDPQNRSHADLEAAVENLHLKDSPERASRKREKSGPKRRSRSQDVADESCLTEEHMREDSTVSDEDLQEVSFVFEDEIVLGFISPIISPIKRMELGSVGSQAGNSSVLLERETEEKNAFFDSLYFGLKEGSSAYRGVELDKTRSSEALGESGIEKPFATKYENKAVQTEEVENQPSDDDDTEDDFDIEGISLFKRDRRG